MGLRDYLLALQIGEKGAQGFREAAEGMARADYQAGFADRLPSLIEQGSVGEIATGALKAGDPSILRELVTAKAKGAGEIFSEADVAPLAQVSGLSPEDLAPFVGKPYKTAQAAATMGQKKEFFEPESKRRRESFEEVKEENLFKQRKFVSDDVEDAKKTAIDQLNVIDSMRKTIDTGNTIGQAAIQDFAARVIGGQKGVLTDQDAARYMPKTFEKDLAGFKTYITGTPQDQWTDDVKEAFKQMFDAAQSKITSHEKKLLAEAISRRVNLSTKLLKDGDLDAGVKRILDREEIEYDVDPKKGLIIKNSLGVSKLNGIKGSDEANAKQRRKLSPEEISAFSQNISNSDEKKKISSALSSMSISNEELTTLKDRLKKKNFWSGE